MTESQPTFRREMIKAYLIPLAVFVFFPVSVLILLSGFDPNFILGMVQICFVIALPALLVGLLLAPWAGRKVNESFYPAAFMAFFAASASIVSIAIIPILEGGEFVWPITAFQAFLAAPISILGAVLFVGLSESHIENRGNS